MSIDCVALLRIASVPDSVHFEQRGDAFLVHTFQRFDGQPADEHAWDLRKVLGDALDAHDDPRGILLFPDVLEPRGQSYDALVAELDHEDALWTPVVGVDHVPHRYTHPESARDALVGQLIEKLGRDDALSLDFMAGVHHVPVFFGHGNDRSELDASLARIEAVLGPGAGARFEAALDETMLEHQQAQAAHEEEMHAVQARIDAGLPAFGTIDLDALAGDPGFAGLVSQLLQRHEPSVREILAKPLDQLTDADLDVLEQTDPTLAASLRQARDA